MRTYSSKTHRPGGFQLWVGPTAAPRQMVVVLEDTNKCVVLTALAQERQRLAGTATTLAVFHKGKGAFVLTRRADIGEILERRAVA